MSSYGLYSRVKNGKKKHYLNKYMGMDGTMLIDLLFDLNSFHTSEEDKIEDVSFIGPDYLDTALLIDEDKKVIRFWTDIMLNEKNEFMSSWYDSEEGNEDIDIDEIKNFNPYANDAFISLVELANPSWDIDFCYSGATEITKEAYRPKRKSSGKNSLDSPNKKKEAISKLLSNFFFLNSDLVFSSYEYVDCQKIINFYWDKHLKLGERILYKCLHVFTLGIINRLHPPSDVHAKILADLEQELGEKKAKTESQLICALLSGDKEQLKLLSLQNHDDPEKIIHLKKLAKLIQEYLNKMSSSQA
jgi:hypothetical protein